MLKSSAKDIVPRKEFVATVGEWGRGAYILRLWVAADGTLDPRTSRTRKGRIPERYQPTAHAVALAHTSAEHMLGGRCRDFTDADRTEPADYARA